MSEIEQYLQEEENYALISEKTPLISNLDIIENISLIKEVHEFISINKAQNISNEYLEKIHLSNIANKRPTACSDTEKLYAMIIRATMCQNKKIIISNLVHLLDNLKDIQDIIKNVENIVTDKNVTILDIFSNEIHYEGCLCRIIK